MNKNEEAYAYADHKTFFRMKTLKEIDDDDYAKIFNDAKEDFLAGYACCLSAAERAFQLFVAGYALQSGEKKLYENSDEYLKTFSEIINT